MNETEKQEDKKWRLPFARFKKIHNCNPSFHQIQETNAMANGETTATVPQPSTPLENNNLENLDIPEEAKAAINQYEAIKTRLNGPVPEWVLPTPDPKTARSQP